MISSFISSTGSSQPEQSDSLEMNASKKPEKSIGNSISQAMNAMSKLRAIVMGGMVCLLLVANSDFDFSVTLTISAGIAMLAFAGVLFGILSNPSTAIGVSTVSMQCFAMVMGARLCSTVFYDGYIPFDRTGDCIYQIFEFFSLVLACAILYQCKKDTNVSEKQPIKLWHLAVPAACLACIFHPDLNEHLPSDLAWTFALYLETIATVPQLYKFTLTHRVETWTATFLALKFASRIVSLVFWIGVQHHLSDPEAHFGFGRWLLIMQSVQLCVLGDFFYRYLICVKRGVPLSSMMDEDSAFFV